MRLDLESIYVVIQTFFQKKRMISKKNFHVSAFRPVGVTILRIWLKK